MAGLVTKNADGYVTITIPPNVARVLFPNEASEYDISELLNSIAEIREDILELTDTVSDKAPIPHASTETTYGQGNASNYGHVKLSDTYQTSVSGGNAAGGLSASQNALYNAYNSLNYYVAESRLTNEDLDTLTETNKTYYAGGGHSCTNVPTQTGTNAFGLHVFRVGNLYLAQILINSAPLNPNIFLRVYNGITSEWGSWFKFIGTEVS